MDNNKDKAFCYCEFIKEFFPNTTLIPVPKDKKKEIEVLIEKYLGCKWFEEDER